MADYFDYDEIYGTDGQDRSSYYPHEKDNLDEEYYEHILEIEETKRIQEQKISISPSKHGYCAPAYRRDLDVENMCQLKKKGYSYRRIARELGCSPNTVRSRLKYQ